MIRIPSEMQIQQMQEIEEENISEAETDSDETEVSDARFRLMILQAVNMLRDLVPLTRDLLEQVYDGAEGRPVRNATVKRAEELLAQIEVEP